MFSIIARRLLHHVPALRWAPLYIRTYLLRDLLSALLFVCIGVPEAIAFASIAGAPPQAGLYALLVASIAYGVFGTRAAVVVGPPSLMSWWWWHPTYTKKCRGDKWV